jgi:hypothetical protein
MGTDDRRTDDEVGPRLDALSFEPLSALAEHEAEVKEFFAEHDAEVKELLAGFEPLIDPSTLAEWEADLKELMDDVQGEA